MGMVSATIFTSPSKRTLCILIRNKNNDVSHVGIPDELEDIRLLLDQRSEDKFDWMSYIDPRIQECISVEFLANCNIWHVNVPLIIFSTVEMHEYNQVEAKKTPHESYVESTCLESSLAPTLHEAPMGEQPPSWTILHANVDNNTDVSAIVDISNILSTIELCNTIHLSTDSVVNTPSIIVLLSMEVQDEDEDRGGGGGEDEENEELKPQLQRNSPRNRQPPGCGTHSGRRR
ncbi:hypothetical protein Gotri_025190 [Gossypium trilobum]|uniref:Uncharacterized protein n=1 Tax=Gossypium trilobum TaxID=34281 RepID=A0A7J9FNH5_9ROSI|nr:hypothetical protein [Gossypium trilobum]